MVTDEQEIRSITITAPGKGEAQLTLSDRRVAVRFDGGWLGSETASIPLEAISYATVAWQRHFFWFFFALVVGACGFLFPDAVSNFQVYAWGVALVSFLVFIFYKPGRVWIYSGGSKLGGTPESTEEAESFVEELAVTLPDLREVN